MLLKEFSNTTREEYRQALHDMNENANKIFNNDTRVLLKSLMRETKYFKLKTMNIDGILYFRFNKKFDTKYKDNVSKVEAFKDILNECLSQELNTTIEIEKCGSIVVDNENNHIILYKNI